MTRNPYPGPDHHQLVCCACGRVVQFEGVGVQDGQLGIYIAYQVLSSKVPGYLADDIHLVSESCARSLRSFLERKCSAVTRVHSRFCDRCFAAAGPRIWNNIPANLYPNE